MADDRHHPSLALVGLVEKVVGAGQALGLRQDLEPQAIGLVLKDLALLDEGGDVLDPMNDGADAAVLEEGGGVDRRPVLLHEHARRIADVVLLQRHLVHALARLHALEGPPKARHASGRRVPGVVREDAEHRPGQDLAGGEGRGQVGVGRVEDAVGRLGRDDQQRSRRAPQYSGVVEHAECPTAALARGKGRPSLRMHPRAPREVAAERQPLGNARPARGRRRHRALLLDDLPGRTPETISRGRCGRASWARNSGPALVPDHCRRRSLRSAATPSTASSSASGVGFAT